MNIIKSFVEASLFMITVVIMSALYIFATPDQMSGEGELASYELANINE